MSNSSLEKEALFIGRWFCHLAEALAFIHAVLMEVKHSYFPYFCAINVTQETCMDLASS
jgi:hypothetical protein